MKSKENKIKKSGLVGQLSPESKARAGFRLPTKPGRVASCSEDCS